MSKWIEANAFIDDLYEHEFSNWCDKDEVSTLVNDAPSIDIVRCKECYMCDDEMWCSFYDSIMESDDFCSYGERR